MKNRKWTILGLFVLFVILTLLVKTNSLAFFDNFCYNIITFKTSNIIIKFYKMITFLGSINFIIFICIIFLVLSSFFKKGKYGIIISFSVIISTIVDNLIKVLIIRQRPNVLSFVTENSYSYPSGHTMASASLCGILIYIVCKSNLNKKIKLVSCAILGIIPILVAISRVYLGAHYISDIIGAFLVSAILLLIETYYIDKNDWI